MYKHMLNLGPSFFFSGSQRTKLFNIYKVQTHFILGTSCNLTKHKIFHSIFSSILFGYWHLFYTSFLLFRFISRFCIFNMLCCILIIHHKIFRNEKISHQKPKNCIKELRFHFFINFCKLLQCQIF